MSPVVDSTTASAHVVMTDALDTSISPTGRSMTSVPD